MVSGVEVNWCFWCRMVGYFEEFIICGIGLEV